jgi:hypothetical protein
MFDTGIAWLRQEIDNLRRDRLRRQDLLKSVEEVVEIVDPIIRLAHSYRKKLLPPVETAVTYCDHLVKSLPGPVRLHRSSYHDDPLVKALFLSPDEMENILQNARNAGIPGTGQEIFALLTMSKTEKTVYGHKQQGEMTLRDVAMQAVTFIDHRVVAPTADLQATETQLQQRSLEILASVAMEKIASFRANLAELRERRARLSSMHRILSGKRCTFEIFAQPEQENAKKIEELKALLSETDKEIELARKEIDTPDDTLGHLVRLMGSAADILVLRQPSLRLNWMNVIVEEGEEDESHPINLAELTLNQELQRSAVLVRFDL